MKLRGLSAAFAVALAVLMVQPSFGEEPPSANDSAASDSTAPSFEAAPDSAVDTAACNPITADLADLDLTNPLQNAFEAVGCTANYNCVHGTLISCSSPVNGTCRASGGGCGQVTCNGLTTRCPGYCYTDIHCWNFCGFGGGTCDWAGCCECD